MAQLLFLFVLLLLLYFACIEMGCPVLILKTLRAFQLLQRLVIMIDS